MTYEEAKIYKQNLENKNKIDSDILKSFDKFKINLGLTPDNIKALPGWKAAKKEYEKSFAELRNFNEWFVKTFKKEYTAERRERKPV